jgi:uncharacterized protein
VFTPLKHFVMALCVPLALAGCASDKVPPGAAADRTPDDRIHPDDVQSLLAAASRATPTQSDELIIRAATIALRNGDRKQAEELADLVRPQENLVNMRNWLYLKARLALASGNGALALKLLQDDRITRDSLTISDQIALGGIRAEAYDLGRNYLASTRERVQIHDLLPDQDKEANHEHIFETLMELPVQTLVLQAERATTSDLRGWLSLAALAKQNQNDPAQQLSEMNRWRKAWAHHPAAMRLPSSLQVLDQIVQWRPKVIALMLPLHGDLGPFGRAIRDGVLAAHYALGNDIRVRVYDTVGNDIIDLVQQARREGAELVIGPLERTQVTSLAGEQHLPLPVLALNRTLDGTTNVDLYQFGLAPEDEVDQIAQRVFMDGKRNALVLYADNSWGGRNYETFRGKWMELGGTIVAAEGYNDQRDYSDLVKGLLKVDASETRAEDLRRTIGQSFEFVPRRRQDIDFILLLADASQARRLNPTLAFFYAEDVPVYATSQVFEYSDSRIDTIDLNGIRFCDIPWKLTESDHLQQAIQGKWSGARSALAQFYALGVDAYRLFPRLQQLREIPDSRVYGGTGVLRLRDNNVVARELMWAQFKDGTANVVPMIIDATSQ